MGLQRTPTALALREGATPLTGESDSVQRVPGTERVLVPGNPGTDSLTKGSPKPKAGAAPNTHDRRSPRPQLQYTCPGRNECSYYAPLGTHPPTKGSPKPKAGAAPNTHDRRSPPATAIHVPWTERVLVLRDPRDSPADQGFPQAEGWGCPEHPRPPLTPLQRQYTCPGRNECSYYTTQRLTRLPRVPPSRRLGPPRTQATAAPPCNGNTRALDGTSARSTRPWDSPADQGFPQAEGWGCPEHPRPPLPPATAIHGPWTERVLVLHGPGTHPLTKGSPKPKAGAAPNTHNRRSPRLQLQYDGEK